jgi:hypothetical protein
VKRLKTKTVAMIRIRFPSASDFTWPDGRESNKVEFFPIVAPIIIESAGAYLSEIFYSNFLKFSWNI